jgi:hypothetical protein
LKCSWLFAGAPAGRADDFLVTAAGVARFAVHFAAAATDRAMDGFGSVTGFAGHVKNLRGECVCD